MSSGCGVLKSLELRELSKTELPAVLVLDRACFGGLWNQAGYQREIDSPNSDVLVLATQSPYGKLTHLETQEEEEEEEEVIVGMSCVWEILEEAHITLLGVDPHYQRQGLGKVLMISLLIAARSRGLERATLEVRASNCRALNLYKKFGFRIAGRRPKYYQDDGEDALILWRGGLHQPDFEQQIQNWRLQLLRRLHHDGWQIDGF